MAFSSSNIILGPGMQERDACFSPRKIRPLNSRRRNSPVTAQTVSLIASCLECIVSDDGIGRERESAVCDPFSMTRPRRSVGLAPEDRPAHIRSQLQVLASVMGTESFTKGEADFQVQTSRPVPRRRRRSGTCGTHMQGTAEKNVAFRVVTGMIGPSLGEQLQHRRAGFRPTGSSCALPQLWCFGAPGQPTGRFRPAAGKLRVSLGCAGAFRFTRPMRNS